MMFEVELTAPQIKMKDGTIVMFWYSDQEIEAKNKTEARKIVKKMIRNEEIDFELMNEDGELFVDAISNDQVEALEEEVFGIFDVPDPEIDQVRLI